MARFYMQVPCLSTVHRALLVMTWVAIRPHKVPLVLSLLRVPHLLLVPDAASFICPSALRPWAPRSLKAQSHSLLAPNKPSHSIHDCFPLSHKGYLAQLLQGNPTYGPRRNPIPAEIHSDLQKALRVQPLLEILVGWDPGLYPHHNILNIKAYPSLPQMFHTKPELNT